MYTQHFGLKRPPFSIAPDPRYLFMSERHREALAHLLYGVRGGGGFVVLTGEIGAGKTTVCRCFLEQIPPRCNVAYIFNPKLSVDELLKTVCAEFHIPHPHFGAGAATVKDYVDALNEYLLRTHSVGHDNLLIIDEAQNLSADVLEQLRLLTNLETNERKLLQIVLIGQPELRSMLARPELQQLAQRVIARYHLEALGESETVQYVQHRLAVAGLKQASPFDRKALRRIFRYSRGVPRRINLLCDRALLGAYASNRSSVDARTVDASAQEVLEPQESRRPRPAAYAGAALLGIGLAAGAALVVGLNFMRAPASGVTAADIAAASAPPANAAAPPSKNELAPPAPVEATPSPTGPEPFDLPTGFASLVDAEDASWQELAKAWNIEIGEADPCQAARKQQIDCYRSGGSTLAQIRLLDRPGILTLRDAQNRAAYAVLTGLSNEHANLRIDGRDRIVSLVALADYWRGEFATFWRVPPGYAGIIADRRAGRSAYWLALQLATARGDSRAIGERFDDAALKAWIHAFQLTQGLPSDGIAGPVTLMRLNRVVGIDEPHLGGGS